MANTASTTTLSPRDPAKLRALYQLSQQEYIDRLAKTAAMRARMQDFIDRRDYWEAAGRELDEMLLDYYENPEVFHVFIGRRQHFGLTRILEEDLDARVAELKTGRADPMWWTQHHAEIKPDFKDKRRKFDAAYDERMAEKELAAIQKATAPILEESRRQAAAEAERKASELNLFEDIFEGGAA
jgi:hypothetical protein